MVIYGLITTELIQTRVRSSRVPRRLRDALEPYSTLDGTLSSASSGETGLVCSSHLFDCHRPTAVRGDAYPARRRLVFWALTGWGLLDAFRLIEAGLRRSWIGRGYSEHR